MDLHPLLTPLLATSTPALPGAALLKWAYPLAWALVLAWGVAAATARLDRPARLGLLALVVVWCFVPGSASPVYWLGLAFQMPSLTAQLLALAALAALLRGGTNPDAGVTPRPAGRPPVPMPLALLWLAVALGWLLLLDMGVVLPFALYRWGFSVAVLAVVVVVAMFYWLAADRPATWGWRWLLPIAVSLFVVTRLPTGNVFDAVLDPWLWLLAHAVLLRRLLHRPAKGD